MEQNTMHLSLSLFSLFLLFPLFSMKSVETDRPGICLVPSVVAKPRFEMDRINNKWITRINNETVYHEGCCDGYTKIKTGSRSIKCEPVCDPPCENSDCMAPDTCVCYPGHVLINNSTNTCYEVCDSCVNGECIHPGDVECTCFWGYLRDPNYPHICDPVCNPQCVSGTCTGPNRCECFDGYLPHSNADMKHVCLPDCIEPCFFGACLGPNKCTCFDGYINDKDSPSICLPICNTTCVNGDCYAPDMCKCRPGYRLHPDDPYLCVQKAPENSTFNDCKLVLPKAVKFDQDSECFLIKENISISVPSNCSVLRRSCSQTEFCRQNECTFDFWCQPIKDHSGQTKLFCNSDMDEDLVTDTADSAHIVNTTDWRDITMLVASFYNLNSSWNPAADTTEWTLKSLSEGPVCAGKHFEVEISNCNQHNPTNQEIPSDHQNINSSFKFWMNLTLVLTFLLMIGAGVGGFLWARHRRLNDPLNYRDGLVRGYTNESYEYDNRAVELVSDDNDSNCSESEAPL